MASHPDRTRPSRHLWPALLSGLLASPAAPAIDLLQSYELALTNDPVYRGAQATAAGSREALPQARSQLLPNLQAAGSQSHATSDTTNVLTRRASTSDYGSYNYSVTLRQPLFRMPAWAAFKQAQANVASAEAVLAKEVQGLGTRVATAYFEALAGEDQLTQVVAQKEAYLVQLQAAQRNFEMGEGTRTDIDEARAKHDIALAQEFEAAENALFTKRQLEALIDRPVTRLARLLPDRIRQQPLQPAGQDEWLALAEANSPELASLRAALEAARQEVTKARAGHLPTLDAFATRRYTESDTENTINQRYTTNQIGIQLSVPLYAGGLNDSQVRQALAGQWRMEEQLEATRRDLSLKVRKQYQTIVQGRLKIDALESAYRSAEQALISTRKGVTAGTRTTPDVLNALQQRATVERDLALARYQYTMARVTLLSLAGRLDLDSLRMMNSWLAEAP